VEGLKIVREKNKKSRRSEGRLLDVGSYHLGPESINIYVRRNLDAEMLMCCYVRNHSKIVPPS